MKKIICLLLGILLMTACSQKIDAPTYLYKVVSMENWETTCKNVSLSKEDESFIHLSTQEQLDHILKKFWADAPGYVVLKLETSRLKGKLVLESNPGGTNKYYHLYEGEIPLSAVVEMKAVKS